MHDCISPNQLLIVVSVCLFFSLKALWWNELQEVGRWRWCNKNDSLWIAYMVTPTVSISQMPHHSSCLIETLCIMQEESLLKTEYCLQLLRWWKQRYTISWSCSEETHLAIEHQSILFLNLVSLSYLRIAKGNVLRRETAAGKAVGFLEGIIGFCRSVWLHWRITTVTWNTRRWGLVWMTLVLTSKCYWIWIRCTVISLPFL